MKTRYLPQVTVVVLALALSFSIYIQNARAEQGHMDRALEALRTARSEINRASDDKGGHRTEALKDINQAIEQVKLGIEVGASHGD